MKSFLVLAVFAASAAAQSSHNVSLAPFRAGARKAFAAEMARATQGDCVNLQTSNQVNRCYEAALVQSEANLEAFRTAIRNTIKARKNLFGPQLLRHFDSSEQIWDQYRAEQGKATAAMVDNPADQSGSSAEMQIDLIRTHMRSLDKIYNIFLNDNCGACLVHQ